MSKGGNKSSLLSNEAGDGVKKAVGKPPVKTNANPAAGASTPNPSDPVPYPGSTDPGIPLSQGLLDRAQKKDPESQYNLAWAYARNGQHNVAINWFIKASQQGHQNAKLDVDYYLKGAGHAHLSKDELLNANMAANRKVVEDDEDELNESNEWPDDNDDNNDNDDKDEKKNDATPAASDKAPNPAKDPTAPKPAAKTPAAVAKSTNAVTTYTNAEIEAFRRRAKGGDPEAKKIIAEYDKKLSGDKPNPTPNPNPPPNYPVDNDGHPDVPFSSELYNKAVREEDPESIYLLAWAFAKGNGTTKNHEQAKFYFEHAANVHKHEKAKIEGVDYYASAEGMKLLSQQKPAATATATTDKSAPPAVSQDATTSDPHQAAYEAKTPEEKLNTWRDEHEAFRNGTSGIADEKEIIANIQHFKGIVEYNKLTEPEKKLAFDDLTEAQKKEIDPKYVTSVKSTPAAIAAPVKQQPAASTTPAQQQQQQQQQPQPVVQTAAVVTTPDLDEPATKVTLKEKKEIDDEILLLDFSEKPEKLSEYMEKTKKAIKNDAGEMLLRLGEFHERANNHKEAFKLYKEARDKGNSSAMFKLGRTYEGRLLPGVAKREPKKAFKYYEEAANAGNVEAQYQAGLMLSRGEGAKQNKRKALEMFQKAGESGHADACFHCGLINQAGLVENNMAHPNPAEALKWFQKASELGSDKAKERLSLDGIKPRPTKPKEAQKEAAAVIDLKKFAEDAYRLGQHFQSKRNYTKGTKWLEKAAKLGNVSAQFALARAYESGETEKFVDLIAARHWYNKVANQTGNADLAEKASNAVANLALIDIRNSKAFGTLGSATQTLIERIISNSDGKISLSDLQTIHQELNNKVTPNLAQWTNDEQVAFRTDMSDLAKQIGKLQPKITATPAPQQPTQTAPAASDKPAATDKKAAEPTPVQKKQTELAEMAKKTHEITLLNGVKSTYTLRPSNVNKPDAPVYTLQPPQIKGANIDDGYRIYITPEGKYEIKRTQQPQPNGPIIETVIGKIDTFEGVIKGVSGDIQRRMQENAPDAAVVQPQPVLNATPNFPTINVTPTQKGAPQQPGQVATGAAGGYGGQFPNQPPSPPPPQPGIPIGFIQNGVIYHYSNNPAQQYYQPPQPWPPMPYNPYGYPGYNHYPDERMQQASHYQQFMRAQHDAYMRMTQGMAQPMQPMQQMQPSSMPFPTANGFPPQYPQNQQYPQQPQFVQQFFPGNQQQVPQQRMQQTPQAGPQGQNLGMAAGAISQNPIPTQRAGAQMPTLVSQTGPFASNAGPRLGTVANTNQAIGTMPSLSAGQQQLGQVTPATLQTPQIVSQPVVPKQPAGPPPTKRTRELLDNTDKMIYRAETSGQLTEYLLGRAINGLKNKSKDQVEKVNLACDAIDKLEEANNALAEQLKTLADELKGAKLVADTFKNDKKEFEKHNAQVKFLQSAIDQTEKQIKENNRILEYAEKANLKKVKSNVHYTAGKGGGFDAIVATTVGTGLILPISMGFMKAGQWAWQAGGKTWEKSKFAAQWFASSANPPDFEGGFQEPVDWIGKKTWNTIITGGKGPFSPWNPILMPFRLLGGLIGGSLWCLGKLTGLVGAAVSLAVGGLVATPTAAVLGSVAGGIVGGIGTPIVAAQLASKEGLSTELIAHKLPAQIMAIGGDKPPEYTTKEDARKYAVISGFERYREDLQELNKHRDHPQYKELLAEKLQEIGEYEQQIYAGYKAQDTLHISEAQHTTSVSTYLENRLGPSEPTPIANKTEGKVTADSSHVAPETEEPSVQHLPGFNASAQNGTSSPSVAVTATAAVKDEKKEQEQHHGPSAAP